MKTCVFMFLWTFTAIQVRGDDATESKMPAAPERIAELVKRGKVKFEFYDDTKIQRKFTGETKYDMKYSFRTSSTWKVSKDRLGKEHLKVRAQFNRLSLTITHRVILPQRFVTDRMFENAIVLHEMDHVRISSDPRFSKVFKDLVAKAATRIELPITSSDEGQLDKLASDTVSALVKKSFEQVRQLVAIRYKELDKVTSHGRRPLPEDYFEMLTF